MRPCGIHATVSWVFQLLVATILLQTLYFKFTGAPESRFIFTQMGIEPWGRIGTGIVELIASGMILHRRLAFLGGLLAAGLMAGAIGSHLTVLGIAVQNDGGLLFTLAVTAFGGAAIVVWLRRAQGLRALAAWGFLGEATLPSEPQCAFCAEPHETEKT